MSEYLLDRLEIVFVYGQLWAGAVRGSPCGRGCQVDVTLEDAKVVVNVSVIVKV